MAPRLTARPVGVWCEQGPLDRRRRIALRLVNPRGHPPQGIARNLHSMLDVDGEKDEADETTRRAVSRAGTGVTPGDFPTSPVLWVAR
jgi:hypothetical protein